MNATPGRPPQAEAEQLRWKKKKQPDLSQLVFEAQNWSFDILLI